MDKGYEIQDMAAPYIKKARNADGRKELAVEANERILKPTREVAAPYVQPYVDSANAKIIQPTRELAAPYVAKLQSKRAAIVESPRYKAALEGLSAVRAHPLEVASDLKSKAIDLIKYDDLVAYREYVQSAEFQADTLKLIREDLPAIARDAARRGVELLHSKARALHEEVQAKRQALMEAWKRGYELGRSIELDDLRARARGLVSELQAQVSSKVEAVKGADYNPHEVIARLTKVFGLDSFFKPAAAPGTAAAGSPSPAAEATPKATPTDSAVEASS